MKSPMQGIFSSRYESGPQKAIDPPIMARKRIARMIQVLFSDFLRRLVIIFERVSVPWSRSVRGFVKFTYSRGALISWGGSAN